MVHRFAHLCEALDRSAHGADAALTADHADRADHANRANRAGGAAPVPQAELLRYFEAASPTDAAWATYLLMGGRLKPALSAAQLHAAALQLCGLPPWLFAESVKAASDLAECVALVMPPPAAISEHGLAHWVEQRLQPLRGMPPEQQTAALAQACNELGTAGRQLALQLLTGAWRSPVHPLQVQHALAQVAGLSTHAVALRLQSDAAWQRAPNAAAYKALLAAPDAATSSGEPYPYSCPFIAARPLRQEPVPAGLGAIDNWLLQWHWGGLPTQVVRRRGQCFIWSAQGELLTARLPELQAACAALPDGTVLTGELMAWPAGAPAPLPQARLQQRLQRKALTAQQRQAVPAVWVARDLLEWQGGDLRSQPLRQRLAQLERLTPLQPLLPANESPAALRRAPALLPPDWAAAQALHQSARSVGAQGLLLRALDATGTGLESPTLHHPAAWVWPAATLKVTTVLLYAQAGYGAGYSAGRSGGGNADGNAGDTVGGSAAEGASGGPATGPFLECSFGVWNRPPQDAAEVQAVLDAITAKRPPPTAPTALRWVPLAKASSGLSAPEWATVHETVRTHALEKFGPVRSLKPSLVVELAFDHIAPSSRHKSGVVLGGVRMVGLRPEMSLQRVASLAGLRPLLFEGDYSLPLNTTHAV